MPTTEPDLSPVVAKAKGLRKGWTTGTCASAAAKAATIGLLTGQTPAEVEVQLPRGQRITFSTADLDPQTPNQAAIIKDAGDDPDCTNGAHVTALVQWASEAEPVASDVASNLGSPIEIRGGDGVGTVTKPGLGLTVAGPAINRVPTKMIQQAITQVLPDVATRPVVCTISIPGGQKMSLKTSNDRLGIAGGISILGTTGIVKPFSTASWRTSVAQQVSVAAAQDAGTIVICTGSRSDTWAQRHMPDLDQVSFVEVGDFTGIALRRAARAGIPKLVFVGMAGKIAKLADGIMMTHFHRSKVNTEFLAKVASDTGAPNSVVKGATQTTTARHFYELCLKHDSIGALQRLCELAAANCQSHAGEYLKVEVILIDFAGQEEICRA